MSRYRAGISFAALFLAIICFISITYGIEAQAQTLSTRHGNLEISTPWARSTPPAARTGAVYLTLANHGNAADRLVAARSTAAAQAELHAHINDGGVMRMKAVDTIVLGPAERVSMRPGGLHVMLIDLKGPLRDGERLSLTLSFANAGDVVIDVPIVRNPPPAAGSHGH